MKILASGCSFTAGGRNPGENWVSHISRQHVVKNLAKAGAGNRYISDSIQIEYQPTYDIVLVMWSGLTRVDMMINALVFDMLSERNKEMLAGNYGYAFIGDIYSHKHTEPLLASVGKEIFKINNEESLGCESLINMINLQSFLKAKKIPYRFMSYVNFWHNKEKTANFNFGIYKYHSCQTLAQNLDFNNFIFYNDQQDGLYEFAVENNLLDKDGFHPNLTAHIEWAKLIREKL